MRTRLLRVFYLLVLGVMVAAYVVTAANSADRNDLYDSFQVIGDQWC
jgi:hypothetical protein